MSATIPARLRVRARRDAAAFYLSQLARGLLSGELTVSDEGDPSQIAPTEFVILEISVKQKHRATLVEVKLRWPTRPFLPAVLSRDRGVSRGRGNGKDSSA